MQYSRSEYIGSMRVMLVCWVGQMELQFQAERIYGSRSAFGRHNGFLEEYFIISYRARQTLSKKVISHSRFCFQ